MIITLTQVEKEHDTNQLHDAFIAAELIPTHVESDDTESRFTFANEADEEAIQGVIDAYVFVEPVYTPTRLEELSASTNTTIRGVKEYVANLTQASTGVPTAVVFRNTFGVEPTFLYQDAGLYAFQMTGQFPADQTDVPPMGRSIDGGEVYAARQNDNRILIQSANGDDQLSGTHFEVRVYDL